MKRIWLVGIVMILAFAAISCDSAWAPVEEPIEYTADGRQIVNMSINLNNNRAMTNELAKSAHDYYEVVFSDKATTPNYYHATWRKGQTGRIRLPTGTYDAILFAGIEKGKILLATGEETDGDTIPITATTTSLTFTMAPLTTDVNETATSTFKVTTPTPPTTIPTVKYEISPGKFRDVPAFKIDENTTAAANMSITIGNGTKIAVDGTATFMSVGLSSDQDDHLVGEIDVTPTLGATLADGLNTIPLAITPPATAGMTKGFARISFSIPVKAFAATSTDQIWNIQGGIDNHLADDGATAQSTGGAIVLAVGVVPTSYVIVSAVMP